MENDDAIRHLENLFKVVKSMRAAQVRYFQNRTRENLQRAMEAEKETDDMLKALAPDFETQARLF